MESLLPTPPSFVPNVINTARRRGYPFSTGGHHHEVLNSDESASQAAMERCRESSDHIAINSCDLVACPKALNDFLTSHNELMAILNAPIPEDQRPPPEIPPPRDQPHTQSVRVTALSVLFVSDDVSPFTKIDFKKFSYENSAPMESAINATMRVMSDDFHMYNLTPEGQAYQRVIEPLPREQGVKKEIPFFLEMRR